MEIIKPADILIPTGLEMSKWSVVACDQFSSQPEYWDAIGELTADVPSTMHMILPEAYLHGRSGENEAEEINAEMRKYLGSGIFRQIPGAYIYLERRLASGETRRGLMAALDLECYDYSKDSCSPVRATEGTVEERLPPRVRIRKNAALELPHTMVFIDDAAGSVIEPLAAVADEMEKLYDFELCAGGGHLRGWLVDKKREEKIEAALSGICRRSREEYTDPVIFAVGDGNHSLATAKKCWEDIKAALPENEAKVHPARYSLVELVNIHDDAISFKPIHRVIFGTDTKDFLRMAEDFRSRNSGQSGDGHILRFVVGENERKIHVNGLTIGQIIRKTDEFCSEYIEHNGGRTDYIHNDETAEKMAKEDGCAAIFLPAMKKTELFHSVASSGPLPKKSFSIGRAEDKRYYLECRKIEGDADEQ